MFLLDMKKWWIIGVVLIVIVVLALFFIGDDYGFLLGEKKSVDDVDKLQLYPTSEDFGGFCGSATRGDCASHSDCAPGGCSGQICQGINEDSIITTCEYNECYNAAAYEVSCGCVNNKCEWRK